MRRNDLRGIAIASVVLGGWTLALTIGLTTPLTGPLDLLWALPLALLLMFLYTGLFITAHDAMHGTLAPGRRWVNSWFGTVSVFVYAFMSYEQLRRAHLIHHDAPGQPGRDPDFHDGRHPGPLRWYLAFLVRYVTLRQVALLVLVFWSLLFVFQVHWTQVMLFWALPSMASTLQLFFVGTYLPHREGRDGPDNEHHARSLDLPVWASFLACYHFGYHLEHHAQPHLPWWRLPSARKTG